MLGKQLVTASKPDYNVIPVQLSAEEFEEFILPHLSLPRRAPGSARRRDSYGSRSKIACKLMRSRAQSSNVMTVIDSTMQSLFQV
jgi:hypothetical protein